MVILSLFDGISCGRVALERAGIKVDKYYGSEVDKNAIKISEKNYPDIIHIGDVTKVEYKDSYLFTEKGKFEVGKIDIIIGGSPCQSFSFSGNQVGMVTEEDKEIITLEQYKDAKSKGFNFKGQSYLFWEYVRLLEEVKPKYFLLENVKMKKHWEEIITKTVGVEPIRINSMLFSAQRRDRLYWTNIKCTELPKENNLVLKDIVRPEDNNDYHLSKQHYEGFMRSYKWKACDLDKKSMPLLASYYKQPPHCPYIPCKESESGYRMLSPIECERLQTLPDNYTDCVSKMHRYKCTGNGWTVDVITHILKGIV